MHKTLIIMVLILSFSLAFATISGGTQTSILGRSFVYCDATRGCLGTPPDLIGINWTTDTLNMPTYMLNVSGGAVNLSGTCTSSCPASLGSGEFYTFFYPEYGIYNFSTNTIASTGNFRMNYSINSKQVLYHLADIAGGCGAGTTAAVPVYISTYNSTHDAIYFNSSTIISQSCGGITSTNNISTTVYTIKGDPIRLGLYQERSGGGNVGGTGSAKITYSTTLTAWQTLHPNRTNINVTGFNGNVTLGADYSFYDMNGSGWGNSNPAQYCRAIIYAGSFQLSPLITYFPSIDSQPNFYNVSDGSAYLKNNSVNYVFDDGSWYTVVPFICYDFVDITAVQAILTPLGSGSVPTQPQIYLTSSCNPTTPATNFTWNLRAINSQTYYFYKRYINGTGAVVFDSSSSTGTSFSGTTNLTNTSWVNITDSNGNILCGWSNSSGTFTSSIPYLQEGNVTTLVGKLVMVGFAATAIVTPFASIPMVLINDIFGFLSDAEILMYCMVAIAASFLLNSFHERNLKNIPFYFAVAFGTFAYLQIISVSNDWGTVSGIPNPTNGTQLTTSITSLSTAIQNADIAAFLASSPSFILAFGSFVLAIPAAIYSGIYSTISFINPNLASAAASFSLLITLAIPAYVLLKLWESLSKSFIKI